MFQTSEMSSVKNKIESRIDEQPSSILLLPE